MLQQRRSRLPRGGHGRLLTERIATGRRAEALVASRLEAQGFTIVGKNVRAGRLELDVVARRGRLLVVCEVRALSSDRLMAPAETITRQKQARIRRAAARWLQESGTRGVDVRFDAAGVVFHADGSASVEYYENCF